MKREEHNKVTRTLTKKELEKIREKRQEQVRGNKITRK